MPSARLIEMPDWSMPNADKEIHLPIENVATDPIVYGWGIVFFAILWLAMLMKSS